MLGVGLGDETEPGFTHFGEVVNVRQRAEMLNEALEIVVGLWTGAPFRVTGKYFAVRDVTFLPRPVQQPRIPIWVGGAYPHRGAVRRAARWDGCCMYKGTDDGSWQDMTPEEVQALRAFVYGHRPADAPFEIVLGGRERGTDVGREALIQSLADAGATW